MCGSTRNLGALGLPSMTTSSTKRTSLETSSSWKLFASDNAGNNEIMTLSGGGRKDQECHEGLYRMTPNLKLRMLWLACSSASLASFSVMSLVSLSSMLTMESPSFSPTRFAFDSSLTWKKRDCGLSNEREPSEEKNLHERLLSACWSPHRRWFSAPKLSPHRPASYRFPSPVASRLSGGWRRLLTERVSLHQQSIPACLQSNRNFNFILKCLKITSKTKSVSPRALGKADRIIAF